jgi:hypothetical protein
MPVLTGFLPRQRQAPADLLLVVARPRAEPVLEGGVVRREKKDRYRGDPALADLPGSLDVDVQEQVAPRIERRLARLPPGPVTVAENVGPFEEPFPGHHGVELRLVHEVVLAPVLLVGAPWARRVGNREIDPVHAGEEALRDARLPRARRGRDHEQRPAIAPAHPLTPGSGSVRESSRTRLSSRARAG